MNAFDFPPEFHTRDIATNGTSIYVRSGGTGPAVILLHGYAETGDMWAPMAVDLARDHTVVVPDLRGMGLSSKPAGGFDKKTQAGDVAGLLDELKIDRADLVTHDIGNMVGYAFAAQYPDRITRFVLIDAPLPGIGPYAVAHIMLLIGRYSRPTLDSWTRPTYARLRGRRRIADRAIHREFRRYGAYAGLAFWLHVTRSWVDEAAARP